MSVENLKDTIVPKSDQLNADDLIAGDLTVTIEAVRRGSKDQPVIIDIGKKHQPYKPCLSMRRVMITAWGDNGHGWVGKSMTLYNDPTVTFGKVAMGGIRISHMTDLNETLHMMLTTSKARRANYKVEPLVVEVEEEKLQDINPFIKQRIEPFTSVDELLAYKDSKVFKDYLASLNAITKDAALKAIMAKEVFLTEG